MATKVIPAADVLVGDVICCSNGDSITVASIRRDGDMIEFSGPQTGYTVFGEESKGGGLYGAFPDESIAVVRR